MKIVLLEKVETLTAAYSQGGTIYDIGSMGLETISFGCVNDVDTPSAKTFDSGVAGSLVVQDLTYTADLRGTAGNSITIAYTAGGTAGAEVVTVVGSAISVQIETAVSTATQVKAAVDGSAAASALISVAITGTGSNAQVVAAATPLAGGVASEVNDTANTITIPSHGLGTALKGQLTTTGTLPTGLSLATDYFVIVVDANTIKLATTAVLAVAGTAVDITSQGSSAAVNTFTPTAVAGASIKLQQANRLQGQAPLYASTVWYDLGSATNITVDSNVYLEKEQPTSKYVRAYLTITAGNITSSLEIIGKGNKNE